MREPVIRDAQPADRPAFVPLWEACLSSHGVRPDDASTDRAWSLFLDAGSGFGVRVACLGGRIVGFAVSFRQPNSWTGGIDGCLDTLFVAPDRRGTGLGRALLDDLVALAEARGWSSLVWHVRADNGPARALYDRYASEDGYRRYRLAIRPAG